MHKSHNLKFYPHPCCIWTLELFSICRLLHNKRQHSRTVGLTRYRVSNVTRDPHYNRPDEWQPINRKRLKRRHVGQCSRTRTGARWTRDQNTRRHTHTRPHRHAGNRLFDGITIMPAKLLSHRRPFIDSLNKYHNNRPVNYEKITGNVNRNSDFLIRLYTLLTFHLTALLTSEHTF